MTRTLCLLAVLALLSSVQGYENLQQKEMTDACLMDISKIATAIPKIIDDIKRGDMVSLMTDVMSTIPLFNQTKNDCRGFHQDDMLNQTTINNIMYCTQSFLPIIDALEVVVNDIIHGKFTKVYDDVLLVLSSAAYSMRVCANIADFVEYPKTIFNFFNTTQCWNSHQRSVNLMYAILHDLQVGNWTDALNLALPFVSASADTLRFCTVDMRSFDLGNEEVAFDSYTTYNFVEIDEKAARMEECKVNLAETIQALSAEKQDLGKVMSLLPKLKSCTNSVDLAALIKSPVVRQIVSMSLSKSFN